MHATLPLLKDTDFPPLRRGTLETLQANLGYTCNQPCLHCHVNAGPNRREQTSREGVAQVLEQLRRNRIPQLDQVFARSIRARTHIRDLVEQDLAGNPVIVADHCHGCTAGQGSSCGGALSD